MNTSKNAPKTYAAQGYFWEITASGPDGSKSQALAELKLMPALHAV